MKKQICGMLFSNPTAAWTAESDYNKDPGVKGTTATAVKCEEDGHWRLSIRDKDGNHLYYW